MKKILSTVLVLMMTLSLSISAFAATVGDETPIEFKVELSSETANIGDTIYASISILGADSFVFDTASNLGGMIKVKMDTTNLTYLPASSTFAAGASCTAAGVNAIAVDLEYNAVTSITLGEIAKLAFTVNSVSADTVCDFEFDENWTELEDYTNEAYLTDMDITYTSDSITLKAAAEEVFDPTAFEGFVDENGLQNGFAAGSKVATVFAKNTSGAALPAKSYGIIFGGCTYVGLEEVADGASWAIRLYDPSGKILVGENYACQTFTSAGAVNATYTLN